MGNTTIYNDQLTVTIASLGAELQSIRDAAGVERLWQGNPAFWTGRAPILFPVAGGFRDDCYELDGQRYPMPKHGFVKKLDWTLESASAAEATFLMTEKNPGFPFDYELRARFTLKGNALAVTYAVENKDARDFWFSVGSHEAFATPEGIEAYEIAFDETETVLNNPLVGNLIKREPETVLAGVRALPLKYSYFAVDALVLRTLKSRGVTLRSALHGREVRVDFPGHDTLMLWTKPGAGYICIEPWCNSPDFVDADYRIDHKPGFLRLAPGESTERTHTITVR